MNRYTAFATLGLALAAVVVIATSSLIAFNMASSNRITPGVSVLDVNVGGLTVDEAAAQLTPRAQTIMDQPVQVQLDQSTWMTSARQLGVQLDPSQLAQNAYAVGRDGSAIDSLKARLSTLRFGEAVPVIGKADAGQVDSLVQRIAAQVDKAPQDAHLKINPDGSLDYQTSEPGVQLDQATARNAIAGALTEGDPQVTLVAHPVAPAVTTDQVSAAHDQLQRILDPQQSVQLTAADYSRTLSMTDVLPLVVLNDPSSGQPASVDLNDDAVQPIIDAAAKAVNQPAKNARFTWDGANVSVLRSSQSGRAVDQQAAHDALVTQILAGAHAVDLPVTTVAPKVTSDDGGASLGIRELIEQSTTSFAGSVPEKAYNIRLAAQRLNGVVVPPGGTFSFNDEVGPTTLEAGFEWGFGLTADQNGGAHTVPSVAGGICQVATTLFQPVFWGGYQLEERYWHLYWIPAYTSRDVVGLDATVDEDSGLDFKWTNTTSDYVLIQSSTTADKVTFSLYGRKPAWKVVVDPAQISNRISPDTTPEVDSEPQLPWGTIIPVETARDGFSVVISRHVINNDGSPERDLTLKSVYQPGRNVTLVGSGNAPNGSAVTAAMDRVRASMGGAVASASAPASAPAATASARAAAAPAAPPAPKPSTYNTGNGPKTLDQIRSELSNAGWAGGSDQDAVATYQHLAASH